MKKAMWWSDVVKMLFRQFPKMTHQNSKPTSEDTIEYTCIAWALGRNDVWCWPDSKGFFFWPIKNRNATPEAFIDMFASFGYTCCDNYTFEEGFKKIVIYIKDDMPTHASRQLENGKWTSKLGADIDIEHDNPEVLNGPEYGLAEIIMKRQNCG
jgi:hypothetical protein